MHVCVTPQNLKQAASRYSEWYITALLSSLDDALILGCTPPMDSLSSHVKVSVHVTATEDSHQH
jgi:hypothetical protein